jgi:pimeloyl-ACP methyl ester carboxylesterase
MMTRRTWRRIVVVMLAVVVMLPLAGTLYEQYARRRDLGRFPPAGRLVNVGGRRDHLLCLGDRTPTVIFESSGFGNSMSSRQARSTLAATTTVCSYDRAGVGWSDAGPSRISVSLLADDLRTLVESAHLKGPFIFVASSIGGLTTELFAREHPGQVAGLLFLDAATSEMFPRVVPMIESSRIGAACAAIGLAGRTGIIRLIDPFGLRQPQRADPLSNALTYGAQPWNTLCAMVRGLPETRRQFESAPPLPASIPVTALSADTTADLAPPGFEQWAVAAKAAIDHGLKALASRSARGSWHVVPQSSHLIADSAPHAVIDAVRDMIEGRHQ